MQEVATGVCKLGVVYVIVNSAFENYVKISKTTNLQQRLRSLDNTSVIAFGSPHGDADVKHAV